MHTYKATGHIFVCKLSEFPHLHKIIHKTTLITEGPLNSICTTIQMFLPLTTGHLKTTNRIRSQSLSRDSFCFYHFFFFFGIASKLQEISKYRRIQSIFFPDLSKLSWCPVTPKYLSVYVLPTSKRILLHNQMTIKIRKHWYVIIANPLTQF